MEEIGGFRLILGEGKFLKKGGFRDCIMANRKEIDLDVLIRLILLLIILFVLLKLFKIL